MAFLDVIGHKTVIALLKRALVNQRVNHAYLFVGPEGIGKKLTAIQFARALNCLEETDDNCGSCRSCKKYTSGNHPDFRIICPENNTISIEEIRNMQKDLVYKPYESKWKIYIFDNAETMTPEGANSLLKTLEEPPGYAVIILLTSQKDSILPTLISRCQLIQFSKLSRDELRKYLQSYHTPDENIDMEEIISLAEGSIGHALKLLEDSQLWDHRNTVLEFLCSLESKTNLEIYEMIQSLKLEKDLRQWDRLFRIIRTFYRDLMILKNAVKPDSNLNSNLKSSSISNSASDSISNSNSNPTSILVSLVINKNYLNNMQQIKSQYSFKELAEVIKLIERTNNVIMTNVDRELALEVLLHKIKARRV